MNALPGLFPKTFVSSFVIHRELVWQLVKRDFASKYKGSVFGIAWSLIHPILMLAVYTLVFGVALNARWGNNEESKVSFAIILFAGLMVHGFFAECLNRAPGLIVGQVNYVKKVLFPLEVLPWVVMITALGQFFIGLLLLTIFSLATGMSIRLGTLLVPIVLLPLMLFTLGLTWFLAALGVYLRDIAQAVGPLTMIALFLSPVFYKASALPESYQFILGLNPLTMPIEQIRDVVLWGLPINWSGWAGSLMLGLGFCFGGFWIFQRLRTGFADVL